MAFWNAKQKQQTKQTNVETNTNLPVLVTSNGILAKRMNGIQLLSDKFDKTKYTQMELCRMYTDLFETLVDDAVDYIDEKALLTNGPLEYFRYIIAQKEFSLHLTRSKDYDNELLPDQLDESNRKRIKQNETDLITSYDCHRHCDEPIMHLLSCIECIAKATEVLGNDAKLNKSTWERLMKDYNLATGFLSGCTKWHKDITPTTALFFPSNKNAYNQEEFVTTLMDAYSDSEAVKQDNATNTEVLKAFMEQNKHDTKWVAFVFHKDYQLCPVGPIFIETEDQQLAEMMQNGTIDMQQIIMETEKGGPIIAANIPEIMKQLEEDKDIDAIRD